MAPAIVSRIQKRMSQSAADRENYAAREDEKQKIADWEAEKRSLDPDEVAESPNKKPVGHSSKYLRKEDFELIKTLGTGTFARVWLAKIANRKEKDNNKVFALKILRKVDVIRLKQVRYRREDLRPAVVPRLSNTSRAPAPLSNMANRFELPGRTCSQRAQCPGIRGRASFHHDVGRQFPGLRHVIHAS